MFLLFILKNVIINLLFFYWFYVFYLFGCLCMYVQMYSQIHWLIYIHNARFKESKSNEL